jgi:hypothetical protein
MTRILIHPGERLADEPEARGISTDQLAKKIPAPTASRSASSTSITAEIW